MAGLFYFNKNVNNFLHDYVYNIKIKCIFTYKLKTMNILLGCEESQAVCIEFRKLGHEAYSCDLQECSGGHPEWHLQMDIFEAIKLKEWDMMIAFPTCTYLTISANKWYKDQPERESGALVGEPRR